MIPGIGIARMTIHDQHQHGDNNASRQSSASSQQQRPQNGFVGRPPRNNRQNSSDSQQQPRHRRHVMNDVQPQPIHNGYETEMNRQELLSGLSGLGTEGHSSLLNRQELGLNRQEPVVNGQGSVLNENPSLLTGHGSGLNGHGSGLNGDILGLQGHARGGNGRGQPEWNGVTYDSSNIRQGFFGIFRNRSGEASRTSPAVNSTSSATGSTVKGNSVTINAITNEIETILTHSRASSSSSNIHRAQQSMAGDGGNLIAHGLRGDNSDVHSAYTEEESGVAGLSVGGTRPQESSTHSIGARARGRAPIAGRRYSQDDNAIEE